MKILLNVSIILFLINYNLNAQDYKNYEFEDGTIIEVKVNSTDPDLGLNGNLYLGFFFPTGHANFIGYSHYIPNKLFLNGSVGLKGGVVDASFLLFNRLKDKTLKQSVKSTYSGNRTTRYVAKIPSKKRRSFGLHAGVEYLNYMTDEQFSKEAIGIIGGISIIGARYANLDIKSYYKARKGSLLNRLNLDLIYYPVRNIGKDLLPDETIDKYLGEFGLRFYYDGRSSFWNRSGRLTLNYMIGIGVSTDNNATPLLAGLGLGYGFSK